MTPEEKFTFVHYLFAAAWGDGHLTGEETEILQTILAGTDLSAEASATVSAWYHEAPPEPDWEFVKNDSEMRSILMRQAMVLAGSDMVFNIEEIQYICSDRGKGY